MIPHVCAILLASSGIAAARHQQYVIVGGGTAGLALAGRLTENPAIEVTVIEAGGDAIAEPTVVDITKYTATISTPLDWNFTTVPQHFAANRSIAYPQGRALGGTSATNIGIFNRGHKAEYDLWETLGAKGWNWKTIFAASKKSEHFYPIISPNQSVVSTPAYHGSQGPIITAQWNTSASAIQYIWPALVSIGGKFTTDAQGGDNNGVMAVPISHEPGVVTRSYSATGYYVPAKNRPNLKVLTLSSATRIIWGSTKGQIIAKGVEYVDTLGKAHTITADRVVLSAGAIKTPQILELSGIGDPTVLKKFGIDTVVNLPGVGANLADHITGYVSWGLKEPSTNAPQIFANFESPSTFLTPQDYATAKKLIQTKDASITNAQHEAQLKLFNADVPWIENLVFAGGDSSGWLFALQHPSSRGTIHIQSSDPLAAPALDFKFLDSAFDRFMFRKAVARLRRLASTSPYKEAVLNETAPGAAVASDADLDAYLAAGLDSLYHPVGTALLGPRKDGGVVDEKLKVYGTANVYVVDASVIPVIPSAHTEATVYAVAELAADLFKSG